MCILLSIQEVPENQRADAANSLVYEANIRLRDPVYGCMGAISALQQQVQFLQAELSALETEILKYKLKEASHANVNLASHATLIASGVVSVAAPPPQLPLPHLPPSSSSSSMYALPSSSTDYSSITNENTSYFGQLFLHLFLDKVCCGKWAVFNLLFFCRPIYTLYIFLINSKHQHTSYIFFCPYYYQFISFFSCYLV